MDTMTISENKPPVTDYGWGMEELSAFEAASEEIKAIISADGAISSSQIQKTITRCNKVVSIVREHFPSAISSSRTTKLVKKTLEAYDVNSKNMLLTQSVCPDEINHEEGDITDLFIHEFGGGKVFHLGGLAGIPFSGKTGFGAFSHHVPDDGHALILQMPHIGMSDALKFGQYTRVGQTKDGAACGAAVGALCHCRAGKDIPNLADATNDFQMNYIIQQIEKCMPSIEQAYLDSGEDENARQAMLAKQTYNVGKSMLDDIISTDFGGNKSMLFVLTGIQINMPFDFEDYFEPISFQCHRSDGTVVDLMEKTFG
jgi:hypothetical protein